jgi:soluble lytic murein transglycosylase
MQRELTDEILRATSEYQIDPLLVLAIVKIESSFRPTVKSNKGARGFMQLRSIAAREVAKDLNLNADHLIRSLDEPSINIRTGVHYLSSLIERFDGNIWNALMAYNQGPTAVKRSYGSRSVPPVNYQKKVIQEYHRFASLTSS